MWQQLAYSCKLHLRIAALVLWGMVRDTIVIRGSCSANFAGLAEQSGLMAAGRLLLTAYFMHVRMQPQNMSSAWSWLACAVCLGRQAAKGIRCQRHQVPKKSGVAEKVSGFFGPCAMREREGERERERHTPHGLDVRNGYCDRCTMTPS